MTTADGRRRRNFEAHDAVGDDGRIQQNEERRPASRFLVSSPLSHRFLKMTHFRLNFLLFRLLNCFEVFPYALRRTFLLIISHKTCKYCKRSLLLTALLIPRSQQSFLSLYRFSF